MILQRLSGSRFSEVLPAWRGETVVLIGGGPSLTVEQVHCVRQAHDETKVRCIAINDSYLLAPFADVLYFADSHWWKWHAVGIAKPALDLTAAEVAYQFATFSGQKCTIQNSGANVTDDSVHMLRNIDASNPADVISNDPSALRTGRHGGFQAMNIAILAGATVAIMLGYDGAPGREKENWHGAHPRPTPPAAYELYRKSFSAAERQLEALAVRVVNSSPGSKIDSFPKMAIEEALARYA